MQYLGHAGTLGVSALPLDCLRLVLTGSQPKLEALFRRRFNRLTKKGELDNIPGRLKDKRPVAMLDSPVRWTPEARPKAKEKRERYSNRGLTEDQRSNMTAYTRGENNGT